MVDFFSFCHENIVNKLNYNPGIYDKIVYNNRVVSSAGGCFRTESSNSPVTKIKVITWNYIIIIINQLFTKCQIFSNDLDFLSQDNRFLFCTWKNISEVWTHNAHKCCPLFVILDSDLSITDEFFEDTMRV